MPKKFDVGYNPKRNGRKEAYIRDIVFGLLHAFCSEYVYYISEV
jgi:hypothetical protein